MGYRTYYELEVSEEGDIPHECPTCGNTTFIDHHTNLSKHIGYDPFEESCKWYEWKTDMINYSMLFPTVLFTLTGEGEESGDIWRAYFKNGRVQEERAKIQIAPFDPNKLGN